jgi:hypothetical protein
MNSSLRRIASHNPDVVVVAVAAAMKMKVKEAVVAAVPCRTTPSNSSNKHKRQPAGDASMFPADIGAYHFALHENNSPSNISPAPREKVGTIGSVLCFVIVSSVCGSVALFAL